MALGFYDTVGGQRFVDHTIPRLVDAIEKNTKALNSLRKEQYTVKANNWGMGAVIKEELEKGSLYLTHFRDDSSTDYIIIFERYCSKDDN